MRGWLNGNGTKKRPDIVECLSTTLLREESHENDERRIIAQTNTYSQIPGKVGTGFGAKEIAACAAFFPRYVVSRYIDAINEAPRYTVEEIRIDADGTQVCSVKRTCNQQHTRHALIASNGSIQVDCGHTHTNGNFPLQSFLSSTLVLSNPFYRYAILMCTLCVSVFVFFVFFLIFRYLTFHRDPQFQAFHASIFLPPACLSESRCLSSSTLTLAGVKNANMCCDQQLTTPQ